jgi:cell division protein FtsB
MGIVVRFDGPRIARENAEVHAEHARMSTLEARAKQLTQEVTEMTLTIRQGRQDLSAYIAVRARKSLELETCLRALGRSLHE